MEKTSETEMLSVGVRQGQVVPISDVDVFLRMVEHLLQEYGRHTEKAALLFSKQIACRLYEAGTLQILSVPCYVAASRTFHNDAPSHVKCIEVPEGNSSDSLCLCVFISETMTFAAFGWVSDDNPMLEKPAFIGGWTYAPDIVRRVAEFLFPKEWVGNLFASFSLPTLSPSDAFILRMFTEYAATLEERWHAIINDKKDLFAVLNILQAISQHRRAHDVLYVFVEQIARVIEADRCSVVRIWTGEGTGYVLASHEDEKISDHPIRLEKYPELMACLANREKVVIQDVSTDPRVASCRAELLRAGIGAILVVPILLYNEQVGSLLLRAIRRSGGFSIREVSFFEIVAEAASNALERAHLFEQVQRANQQLERLAITDGLTRLYNHRYFMQRLEEEFHRAVRYRLPLSCILFDVDDFKRINDTFGHLKGDQVLREIADRTSRCVRRTDLLARYGGEEFVVLLPQTDLEGARIEADRLREHISDKPYAGLPSDWRITVSIGVSTLRHEYMRLAEDILRAADLALYHSKTTGKDRVSFHEEVEHSP